MKTLRSLLWVLAFVLGASVASAMNNNDVVKMVKAELDDDTVILAINSAKSSEFDTSANALVELKNKGVEFTMEIEDHGFGLVTFFKMPGDVTVQLYQPHYQKHSASS